MFESPEEHTAPHVSPTLLKDCFFHPVPICRLVMKLVRLAAGTMEMKCAHRSPPSYTRASSRRRLKSQRECSCVSVTLTHPLWSEASHLYKQLLIRCPALCQGARLSLLLLLG